ncbi:hypothetical protein [Dactylosporangium sp. NPDC051484]|uniref:hypothetical protein n=1 Tax=Dactylosporangium sp. NPDC051484 TaxID=3154942 RepID=UPI00344D29C3
MTSHSTTSYAPLVRDNSGELATVIDLATWRTPSPSPQGTIIAPTTAWWHCPAWCSGDDDCTGGEIYVSGAGGQTPFSRGHHGVLLAEEVQHLDGGMVDVRVEVSAYEDRIEGYVEPPSVDVCAGDLDLKTFDLDAAERIAHAILDAVAAARTALPASRQAVMSA